MLRSEGGTLQLEVEEPIDWTDTSQPLPTFITPSGFRIPTAALFRWASMNGVANSPTATQFTFPQLEPGPYRVCWMTAADLASRDSAPGGCAAGRVEPGGVQTLHSPGPGSRLLDLAQRTSTPPGLNCERSEARFSIFRLPNPIREKTTPRSLLPAGSLLLPAAQSTTAVERSSLEGGRKGM